MNLPTMLAAATPGSGSFLQQYNGYILMGVMFAIFYFILIVPMRKKQKKHSEMLANLKNGDKIVTQGGLHGTVAGVSDTVVQVRIADGVKIEVARTAVSALRSEAGSDS